MALRGHKIPVINKGLKDYALEMGGNINKISVVPAGVDLERFNPQVDGSAIREKYGIKKDEIGQQFRAQRSERTIDEIEYLNDKFKIKEIEGMGNEMTNHYKVLGKVK